MSLNPIQLAKLVKQYQTEAAKGNYIASNKEHNEMYEVLINNAKNEGTLDETSWKELLGFTQTSVKTNDFENKKNKNPEVVLDDNINVKDFLKLVEKYQLEADKKGNYNIKYEKRDADLYKKIIGAACAKGEISKETYDQLLQFERFGITTKTAEEEIQEKEQEKNSNEPKKLDTKINKNYFAGNNDVMDELKERTGAKYYINSAQGSDDEKNCTAIARLTEDESKPEASVKEMVLLDPKGKNELKIDANANASYSKIEVKGLIEDKVAAIQTEKATNYVADINFNKRKVLDNSELFVQGNLNYNGSTSDISANYDDTNVSYKSEHNSIKANLGGTIFNYENGDCFGVFGEYKKKYNVTEEKGSSNKYADEMIRIEAGFSKPLANGDRMGAEIDYNSSTISNTTISSQKMEFIYSKKLSGNNSALNSGLGCRHIGNSVPFNATIGHQKTLKHFSYDYAVAPYYDPKGNSVGADLKANASCLYTKQNHRFEATANLLYINDMRLGTLQTVKVSDDNPQTEQTTEVSTAANTETTSTVSRSNGAIRINGIAQYSYYNKNHKGSITLSGEYLNAQNYITSAINGEAKYQYNSNDRGTLSVGVRGTYGTCHVNLPANFASDASAWSIGGFLCYKFNK